jgi:SNF family Na+-dependent transporter
MVGKMDTQSCFIQMYAIIHVEILSAGIRKLNSIFKIIINLQWAVLAKAKVWLAAGTQIFFSLGVAYGCLVVFASYLPSNNNCYRDAVTVSLINCSTSLFAALVIFPVLGWS